VNGASSWSDPLKDKWFYPITCRVEQFENSLDMFADFGSVTSPESPDWVVQCVWRQAGPYREIAGLERHDLIRARHVGAMIGAKASLCKRLARGNLWFAQLSSKRQSELENLFGEESIAEAKQTWSRFAVEIQPEFKRIRRFAVELTMAQEILEQILFYQGLAKGLTLMDRIAEVARQRNKRAIEYGRRSLVCLFAVEHWELIEAAKKDIAWSDLVQEFDQQYGEHVVIDEESFKKILQRSGLTVGRVGRPPKAR
jgi:hypothetical protein